MISLQDRKWKSFSIYELFETQPFKDRLQLPTGANIKKENLDVGNDARVTVTSTNNGIYGFYTSNDKNYRTFENIVSLSFLGDCFYHPYRCSLDMKVHCLKLKDKEWNKYLASFFINQLHNNTKQANYGNQLSSTDAPYKKIMLPVNDKSLPDYEFMELYMRQMENNLLNKEIDYIKSKLKEIGSKKDVKDLNCCNWKKFNVKELFDDVQRGKRLKTEDHISGDIPYVSSTALNNGVDRFIGNENNVRRFKDCLSLANSGSVGSCFYEPFEFIASDHITHLKNNSFNKYHYLFMATMLNRLSDKYNFNREINDARISKEIILLPIKDDSTLDYDYMEQYIKNVMIDKYNKLLEFISD